ncbi:MAG: cytochrome c-type biogenesis protein CcmH [Anaerolineae bacterium]|nr:cytochrome c-type biogenesis protein CcmH [Anaerolineae bacterium]
MKRYLTIGVGAHGRAPLPTQYERLVNLAILALLGAIIFAALPIVAQEATQPVTFDQVNAIANTLYCPVCPGETLDVCQTQACAQWREEIRQQLAAGQTEQEIVDSFVRRYGDRVLGSPQDPGLRTLSLIAPILVVTLALVIGVFTFLRWRTRSIPAVSPAASTPASDDYRKQLERDLRE